jgi:hypothetical protein
LKEVVRISIGKLYKLKRIKLNKKKEKRESEKLSDEGLKKDYFIFILIQIIKIFIFYF